MDGTEILCFECHDEEEINPLGSHSVVSDEAVIDCQSCHGDASEHADEESDNGGETYDEEGNPLVYRIDQLGRPLIVENCLRSGCHDGLDGYEHSKHNEKGYSCFTCHKIHTHDLTEMEEGVVEDEKDDHVFVDFWKDTGPSQHLLRQPRPQLCIVCHEQTADSFHHSVRGNKNCGDCHDPHEEKPTCRTCHPRTEIADLNPIHHRSSKSCTFCHEMDRVVAKETHRNGVDLEGCTVCHLGKLRSTRTYHHSAEEEDSCGVCHRSGNLENSCASVGCHATFLFGGINPHGARLESGTENSCLICHNPHGSDNEALLQDDFEWTCIRCHPYVKNHEEKTMGRECVECHQDLHVSDGPNEGRP